uniref:Acyl carrier protein n=1 Tax=Trichobilharzia regenti TaxID=157069 RepID=A0AA85IZ84_TRIRE|nr:unnamed protein product [Trichobilharzia regenti]
MIDCFKRFFKMIARLMGPALFNSLRCLRNTVTPSFARISSFTKCVFENKLPTYTCFNQPRRWIKCGLSRAEVEDKVLAVCSAYDKIQSDKLTLDSSFMKDLGLDSLDHIEVIMEIENEFCRYDVNLIIPTEVIFGFVIKHC